MPLTTQIVSEELYALDFGAQANPLGFSLGPSERGRAARLRRGSGIAGRGNIWRIVSIKGNEVFSDQLYTRAQLRKAIKEYLAGPKPDPGSDCTKPRIVRLDDETMRRRFERYGVAESPFVWKWRVKKTPPSKLVHYGYINHKSP